MKSGLLKKLLLFLVVTLIVYALLIALVFTFTSRSMFANIKAEELIPRARFVSDIMAQFQRGEISVFAFERILNSDNALWDATVHIFNSDGSVFARTVTKESEQVFAYLADYVAPVLDGSRNMLVSASDEIGIVVGVPVYGADAVITGAVFLTKPLDEVNTAFSGLNMALLISTLLIFLVMLIPTYFGSKRFTDPLMQMSKAAQAMAKGDFTVRAAQSGKDEIGQLGRSLNELSQALSRTIGDLMLERNRLQNVLDGLREGIVAMDTFKNVTHCNPAALRLLGLAEGTEQQAVSALELLWPDYKQAADGGLQTHTVSLNGIQLQLTLSELTGRDGVRAGTVAMIQDVTEQARLEQTRRDYVANVSHELRTPIVSIRGLADALHDGMVKKQEDRHRYYGYIVRESMRLSRLIDDLLELSRLQSRGVALDKRRFRINELMEMLAGRFEVIAGDSGLQFELHMPDEALYAYSNEDRIEQVLIALLDNAIKYAADEGRVTLCVEKQADECLLVSVRNTGHISEEHLPNLFERFYKADTAHAEQGTGLGLAIAREIMTLLKERIWVENQGEDACFLFTLHMQEK